VIYRKFSGKLKVNYR